MWYSNVVALFTAGAILATVPIVHATEETPACPNGVCPGLGQAFYLPGTNLLDAKSNSSGRAVFKDVRLGVCATQVDRKSSFRSFQTYDSASKLTEALNAGINAEAGFPVKQVNVGTTVEATTGRTSVQTEAFNAVALNIEFVNQVIDFNQTSACLSPDNLDPSFQSAFEALALPNAEQAGENFTWAAYMLFLKNWGSHFQSQQWLGSRVQQWVSSKTGTIETTDTLKAKACFDLEGFTGGWSASPCATIDSSKRYEASTKETNDRRYIVGGTTATRTALLQNFNEANLNQFIATAAQGDEPIGFSHIPLWSVLQEVYRTPCGQAGKGSIACQNLQRAVTLQAAYEGFGAYACGKRLDGRNAVIQTMRAQGPDGLGIYYFACHQSKTGCRENSDCKVYPGEFGFQCYCEGPSCIDASSIPGTALQRNFVRGKTEYDYWNSDKGVNASCEDKILSCNCDEGWAGGQLARDIWDQALPVQGSIARTAGTPSLGTVGLAQADNGNANSVPDPSFYTLQVDVGTQEILTKTEARRAEKAKQRAEAQGNAIHNRIISTPAGIDCPGECVASFPKGTPVTLSYVENLDHQFVEWTGTACYKRSNNQATKGKTCLIEHMDEAKRVGAIFRIAPK